MNLFIDTNTWLSFYHFSGDDLEELRKVAVLIRAGKLTLYLPSQVVDEFWRNRDGKIADAIARFKEEKLSGQFPQICKDYLEYQQLIEALKVYRQAKSSLLDKLTEDISSGSLKADPVIAELFAVATKIDITEEIWSKAKRRFDLGNPPGKNQSYGDAVNWETLLGAVPDGEDLYFVTEDSDFTARTDKDRFSPFLVREWETKRRSTIHFFKSLSAFFSEKFPEVRLATELHKEILVQDLVGSLSYLNTRRTLRQLTNIPDLTSGQLNEIIDAALTNGQIYRIAGDADINLYLGQLVQGREDSLEPKKLQRFKALLQGSDFHEYPDYPDDDDLPT
jgi:predicted nucleic acid-binding protein